MNCPRCNSQLTAEVLQDVNNQIEVDQCKTCGGTWFDQGELSQIDKLVEPTILEIRKIPREDEQLEALYCPSCSDHPMLGKADHPRDEKVIIDFCPTCKGIWLDRGELQAIQKENWLLTIVKIFRWLLGKD